MATSNSTSTCLISPIFDHYNITDLPDSVVPVWTSLAIANGIAAPFTAAFNALIILTVLKDHRLRSKSYMILLSALAFSDLLVGLVVNPLNCWFFVCLLTKCDTPCISTALAFFGVICTGLTVCTLMMLSVERYFAIELPMFHLVQVTSKRVMIIAVAVWVTVPSVMIVLRVLLNNFETFKKVPTIRVALGNVLVTLYCTVKVHITAYLRKKKPKTSLSASTSQQSQGDQEDQRKRQIQEYKRALTMGILVLTSIIFYIPFITVNIIQASKGKDITEEFQYIAPSIANTILLLQSLLNPVIMSLRLREIRKRVKSQILCCFNEH